MIQKVKKQSYKTQKNFLNAILNFNHASKYLKAEYVNKNLIKHSQKTQIGGVEPPALGTLTLLKPLVYLAKFVLVLKHVIAKICMIVNFVSSSVETNVKVLKILRKTETQMFHALFIHYKL